MNRASVSILTICTLAVWLTLPPSSRAADGAGDQAIYEEIDAQEIIDHCWDISLVLRSGSTNSTYYGFIETIICLKTEIVELAVPMFEPDVFSRARIEWLLMGMAHPYGEFLRRLKNQHKQCYCGSQFANTDVWGVTQLYERILRDVVAERNAYHF